MDLHFSAADEAFRGEARDWLQHELTGDFASLRGRGGPGDEHSLFEERLAWERRLGDAGWVGVGWPREHGGRGLSLPQQMLWHEEYARAEGPGRLGHIGEGLAGPTIIAFGTADQQRRFLPGILAGRELWCQGYSEPDAGSDLANVATRAVLEGAGDGGEHWIIRGQKVWTSLAHWAQWCFVLARTHPSAPKHKGLSYLLVPMDQPGIEVRPIRQLTGTSEFNEVFFDGARTAAENVVGAPGDGWRVAMGTLAFERGASTLGQQLNFANELRRITQVAQKSGRLDDDAVLRRRLVQAEAGLRIMRWNTLRTLSADAGASTGAGAGPPSAVAAIGKLYWATWHRALGNLALDVLGAEAMVDNVFTNSFLFTRSDTIYAGSNQIQRNLIGERTLGLPKEPA